MKHGTTDSSRRGMAYFMILLVMAVFAVLGTSMALLSDSNLVMTENLRRSSDALLASESGMSFISAHLSRIRLPGATTQETFLTNLRTALARKLDGTPNLAGRTLRVDSTCLYIPPIRMGDRTFECWIGWVAANRARLTVRGTSGTVVRDVALDYRLVEKLARAFDYGLASRGKILLSKGSILGVNNPQEANVVSVTESDLESILVSNEVSGDLSAAGDGHYISVLGGAIVGGQSDPALMAEHLHFGIDPPDIPDVDPRYLKPLATNIWTSRTGKTLTNTLVQANSNPSFAGGTKIYGILYIEQPNQVIFSGNCQINGMVLTDPGGDPSLCLIDFRGNVEVSSVDSLPNTPEFAYIRQQTGTFIAVPGFAVSFGGNVGTIKGSVAADKLTWYGSASGIVRGTMIQLRDVPTTVDCTGPIYFDRSLMDQSPATFSKSFAFESVPDSYQE